ncbi:glutamate racemase [Amaricoccus solimangrovi]|uniref:Glutamate racemase n=1 Tax=Amaricoccus solimangrovi TaxID=2589815 RepID=A0A501WHS1_9RHOB|nr:aspartate/glutamate racemase family protein [Amaricoccus solimangrovi]TPE49433.1 glutamate racemase [Amaricoccus solimangrovi]
MPIGVFDSGLGGLTILEALRRALPGQDFVYLGDNANAPYGPRPPVEIYDLTIAGVARLFEEGCGLVILACNTASAVALHDLQVNWLNPAAHRVLGVFVPVIEHLTRRDWGDNTPPTHTGLRDVALFATAATVQSGAFPRELRFRARDVTVVPRACVGLVEAIEAGELAAAALIARDHVEALLRHLPAPQSAVLGCTHYPLVEAAFRAALPRATTLVSQPALIAASLADYLGRHRRFEGGSGAVSYLTTGDPAAVGARARVFTGTALPFRSA